MRMEEERIAIGCAPVSALRVRFCPSPTGLLHVGGVRTALYNWLYARRRSGVMVLRIEDTDEARENPEAIEQIQRSLRWCGLDWDEGPGVGGPHEPYLQSERRPLHLAAVEKMLEEGTAYRCYCTRRGARRRAQGRAGCRAADGLLPEVPLADRGAARRARGLGPAPGDPARDPRRGRGRDRRPRARRDPLRERAARRPRDRALGRRSRPTTS